MLSLTMKSYAKRGRKLKNLIDLNRVFDVPLITLQFQSKISPKYLKRCKMQLWDLELNWTLQERELASVKIRSCSKVINHSLLSIEKKKLVVIESSLLNI